ncbi:MAG TPA: molybdopterin cofactor-binding domain-containing protein [Gaiellaceae bacterium]|nr:molybdopterin cofactor-binding domain-containing protein [Gaiellaceae bacterium]
MPLLVNGVEYDPAAGPAWTLLRVLRERLGLTAAKPGCGEGACGACTVLVDSQPVRSCVTTLEEIGARPVVTLEGLTPPGTLNPLQQAFLELNAFQCGYCTPGMIVSATALLAADSDPDEDAIAAALQGNVCRCCAYPRILRAVRRAAELGAQPVVAPPARREPELGRPARPWDLVASSERDWFAVLPDGLVAVAEADSTAGRWSTSAGAWIHVGFDGAVTAFTGKVDVGQGNSTALSLLVAVELGVELESVSLVMGDTDLCPYDEGTFGSRSMADAGPLLRAAAAAARRSLASRPLAAGERRVELAATDVTQSTASPAEVVRRQNGLGIVTGSARFPSDLTRPGLVHGSAPKPSSPDARPRSLDTDAAQAISGATVVREDSFVGVTAPDRDTLDRAIEALAPEWQPPAGPDEDELEVYLRAHPAEAEGWMTALDEEVGNVRLALAQAEVLLETTYRTAYVAHVPLETRAALAEWDAGRLTVSTGTQRPFGVRAELAEELSLAEEDVRVVAPTAGAGFGGKHRGEAAIEAARLARATGQPVKVHWTRAEEFAAAYLRPAAVIDVRSGARADGTLTAWEFVNVSSGAAGIASPYVAPNRRLVFQPAESPLRQGSYRALAATANHFARESHIDELAHQVGADPVELRLRQLEDERLAEVLRAAADRAGWNGNGMTLGIACGVEKEARVATCAEVRVGRDGATRVTRIVTAFDCGAIVDRNNLENQIEGATVMGLGGALFERVRFTRGRLLTQSLSEYRVPRFGDVPAIEVVLLDRRDVPPAGAGETPIVCVAPAIANALYAATGERRRSLPLLG